MNVDQARGVRFLRAEMSGFDEWVNWQREVFWCLSQASNLPPQFSANIEDKISNAVGNSWNGFLFSYTEVIVYNTKRSTRIVYLHQCVYHCLPLTFHLRKKNMFDRDFDQSSVFLWQMFNLKQSLLLIHCKPEEIYWSNVLFGLNTVWQTFPFLSWQEALMSSK